MTQTQLSESLESSLGFYKLFQTLDPEIRQGFLKLLFQEYSSELEDFILYLACKNARQEGFLSEIEAQIFLDILPA